MPDLFDPSRRDARRNASRMPLAAGALGGLAGLVLATILMGCSGQTAPATPDSAAVPGADVSGDALSLVVRDAELRRIGEECSGAGSYLFIHAGATVTVTPAEASASTPDPESVRATLPAGTAIAADDRDYGTAERVPSLCRFDLTAPDLRSGVTYSVSVDGREVGSLQRGDDDAPATLLIPALGDPSSATTHSEDAPR